MDIGKTPTILGPVTIEGVLSAATLPDAIFVREVLTPSLRPGMVVVMDNLAAHKVVALRQVTAADRLNCFEACGHTLHLK